MAGASVQLFIHLSTCVSVICEGMGGVSVPEGLALSLGSVGWGSGGNPSNLRSFGRDPLASYPSSNKPGPSSPAD